MILLNLTLDQGDADTDRHAPATINADAIAYVTRASTGTNDSPAQIHLWNGHILRVVESYETVSQVLHHFADRTDEWIPLSGTAGTFAETLIQLLDHQPATPQDGPTS